MKPSPSHTRNAGTAANVTSFAGLAATTLAARQWPILPGTYQIDGQRSWRGKREAAGLEPAVDMAAATTNLIQVAAWWECEPYSVLLACGHTVDALEIAASVGTKVVEPLRRAGTCAPVVVTPSGTTLVFVRSGTPLSPALAATSLVNHRAAGTWAGLPPTVHGDAAYRWRIAPEQSGWHLADSIDVQDVLAASLPRIAGVPGAPPRHTFGQVSPR